MEPSEDQSIFWKSASIWASWNKNKPRHIRSQCCCFICLLIGCWCLFLVLCYLVKLDFRVFYRKLWVVVIDSNSLQLVKPHRLLPQKLTTVIFRQTHCATDRPVRTQDVLHLDDVTSVLRISGKWVTTSRGSRSSTLMRHRQLSPPPLQPRKTSLLLLLLWLSIVKLWLSDVFN